ncbi:DNA polymerase III subunit chi [Gayadomonas joobiniege]|uniref:DNA polymerase III subunit chi n=1 Tax=Gayadomonas joobiniege TaxID=1234606 RepID=UPI00037430CE|nr:DNA polymerase III subunit chi [Gayadomonas joobiniege]
MAAQVTFYLLPEEGSPGGPSSAQLYACQLASEYYRKRQSLFIYCAGQTQAEQIDELLWQFDPARFVPHQLQGEKSRKRPPVEVGYQASQQGFHILINLTDEVPEFAGQFRQIFDFVPADNSGKEKARSRYKNYRAAGYELTTQPAQFAPTETE